MSFESVYVRRVELQARRSDIARLPRERGHSPLTSSESCLLGFSGLTIEDRERNGGGMMVVECVVRGTSSDVAPNGIHTRSQENVRQFNGSPRENPTRETCLQSPREDPDHRVICIVHLARACVVRS